MQSDLCAGFLERIVRIIRGFTVAHTKTNKSAVRYTQYTFYKLHAREVDSWVADSNQPPTHVTQGPHCKDRYHDEFDPLTNLFRVQNAIRKLRLPPLYLNAINLIILGKCINIVHHYMNRFDA